MGKKLYVGNLNFRTTDDSLADAFAARGFSVLSAKIIVDRETGRSRGFAFVEFRSDEEAEQALAGMHDQDVEGRAIKVTEARAKSDGPSGGFRGGADRPGPRGGYEGGPPRSTGPRGGFEGRGSYEGGAPRGGYEGGSRSGSDGGSSRAGHEGGGSRGSYEGGRPTGSYGGPRGDERPPRDFGGEGAARGGFRSAEPRGGRFGGGFAGPPPPGAAPFGAEDPAGGRRGRGERRDLRKQHQRRDESFDDDDEY